jgi:hypothetical protein
MWTYFSSQSLNCLKGNYHASETLFLFLEFFSALNFVDEHSDW